MNEHRKLMHVIAAIAALVCFAIGGAAQESETKSPEAPAAVALPDSMAPSTITVKVGNRLYPEYREVFTVNMLQRAQIGDTDLFFEISEFFPHFAMIDSTKEVVSLSEELKNPAFKIHIYENDEYKEATWAFYAIKVPHYSRQAYLHFEVLSFQYRGKLIEQ